MVFGHFQEFSGRFYRYRVILGKFQHFLHVPMGTMALDYLGAIWAVLLVLMSFLAVP